MNAIPPMMRALEGKKVKVLHYLDSYILEKNSFCASKLLS